MPNRLASLRALLLCTILIPALATAQAREIPPSPGSWIATDSIRFVSHLDRPSIYINRGVALVQGATMENGTFELDLAATDTTTFLGVVFRAASPRFSNVIFLRPGSSGTEEAVQYGPAFNTLGVAWQVYHFAGANAVAAVPRNRWIHLRVELDGQMVRFFVDSATTPTLVVPRVVTSGGAGIGLWAGPFGHGAYYSNVRYTPGARTIADTPAPPPPTGTVFHWDLSNTIEAKDFVPTRLPNLARLTWQKVDAEPEGFVLVNRYREAPVGGVPRDSTGAVLGDSVMTGKVAGGRIVYARTTITAARDGMRRLEYAYNNGVVIYLNGRPLAFTMNPGGFRTTLGAMAKRGDAVYLPLRRGRNQLVFAIIDLTGGWAFSGRLDPR